MKVRTKDSKGDDALAWLEHSASSLFSEPEEDRDKLQNYLEARAQSEGNADKFKAFECPCKTCVARRAAPQQEESEGEDVIVMQ